MPAPSDALVLFGATGDLAHKMIYPALYTMALQGVPRVPVIGVAASDWAVARLREVVAQTVRRLPGFADEAALADLLARLRYVSGDYTDAKTYAALKSCLGGATRPAHYLAIPPTLFETVINGLGTAGLAAGGRVIIEKPFGRDLASARALDQAARAVFDDDSIFRIDHYLGKEAIMNILYFRFANSFLEPIWNGAHIASVQITLSEDFDIDGRGRFYESAGCLRDVVQNHMFQIVALLAMEPPADQNFGAIHSAKADLFRAMRPLATADLVRGQYLGYRAAANVAADSDVETFCALRLFIDSPRWQGVPWYLRAGKAMAMTAAEVIVQLKPPAAALFDDAEMGPSNYLRFRLSPTAAIALAARVKRAGRAFVGDQRELVLQDTSQPGQSPYARLLTDALAGDGALFTREDAVEAAWAVVEPVLHDHDLALPYAQQSWGPAQADALIGADGPWRNPQPNAPVETPARGADARVA